MNIKCLIIDDEPIGRDIIESYVARVDFLELVASCEDVFEAMTYIEKGKVDLILSDIQMPKVNGIEFIKSLPSAPLIIFITAHDKFAVEGYEMGIADYLLKPVPFDRFLKAINRARQLISLQSTASMPQKTARTNHIFIKVENKLAKILYKEILYIEASKDYQKIHLLNSKSIIVYATLKSMEERLPADIFFRIHYSYIVSIEKIISVQGNTLELSNGKSLTIAASKKDELLQQLHLGK